MRKQIIETCEMCSAEVRNPITIKVEGALLRVCHKCSSFGNIVSEPPKRLPQQKNTQQLSKSPKSTKKFPRQSFQGKAENAEKELIPDYGREIKGARMAKKLTQDKLASLTGLTSSFIKGIESEKIRPTDVAVRKLERELDIELFIVLDTELQYSEKSKAKGTTLGDIAVIKHFDYDRE